MPNLLPTLRSIANAFLGKTCKPDRIDTVTSMAMDAGQGRALIVEAPVECAGDSSRPARVWPRSIDNGRHDLNRALALRLTSEIGRLVLALGI